MFLVNLLAALNFAVFLNNKHLQNKKKTLKTLKNVFTSMVDTPWSVDSRKISQFVCHQMSDFKAKMHHHYTFIRPNHDMTVDKFRTHC